MWQLYALRWKSEGRHLRRIIANKCNNVRGRVEGLDRNKDVSSPVPAVLWIVSVDERKPKLKKKKNIDFIATFSLVKAALSPVIE